MKRRYYLVISLLGIVSLMLGILGCIKPAPPSAANEVQKSLHIGVGEAGPSKIIGTALSTLMSKYAGMEASTELGVGMSVYPFLNTGELDIVPYSLAVPLQAYQGIGVEKTRLRDLSAAKFPTITVATIITRPDTGIKTVKDLRGKKVSSQPAFPYFKSILVATLKVNGMTLNDITVLDSGTLDESVTNVIEKRADAIVNVMGAATDQIRQAVGAYFIPFSPAEQAAIIGLEPSFLPYTAAKGFRGLEVDTPLVAAPFHLVARAAMNDITAYTIVKTLYEHIDEFRAVNPTNAGFTLDAATSHLVIPMHPGAVKYYQEVNIWTSKEDSRQKELLSIEKKLYGD